MMRVFGITRAMTQPLPRVLATLVLASAASSALAGVSVTLGFFHGGYQGHGFHYYRHHGHQRLHLGYSIPLFHYYSRHHHYRHRPYYRYHPYPRYSYHEYHSYPRYSYRSYVPRYYEPRRSERYTYERSSRAWETRSHSSALARPRADDGWALLSSGRADAAIGAFGTEAERTPADGRARAGLSIASAAAGDLRGGVAAMRDALRTDPGSLGEMRIPDAARATVVELINRYAESEREPPTDAAFMRAALHYLLHHRELAGGAVAEAVRSGDDSESVRNLERLLAEPTA